MLGVVGLGFLHNASTSMIRSLPFDSEKFQRSFTHAAV